MTLTVAPATTRPCGSVRVPETPDAAAATEALSLQNKSIVEIRISQFMDVNIVFQLPYFCAEGVTIASVARARSDSGACNAAESWR
jgi:hypothetical protein